jgi:hypothetical protein
MTVVARDEVEGPEAVEARRGVKGMEYMSHACKSPVLVAALRTAISAWFEELAAKGWERG